MGSNRHELHQYGIKAAIEATSRFERRIPRGSAPKFEKSRELSGPASAEQSVGARPSNCAAQIPILDASVMSRMQYSGTTAPTVLRIFPPESHFSHCKSHFRIRPVDGTSWHLVALGGTMPAAVSAHVTGFFHATHHAYTTEVVVDGYRYRLGLRYSTFLLSFERLSALDPGFAFDFPPKGSLFFSPKPEDRQERLEAFLQAAIARVDALGRPQELVEIVEDLLQVPEHLKESADKKREEDDDSQTTSDESLPDDDHAHQQQDKAAAEADDEEDKPSVAEEERNSDVEGHAPVAPLLIAVEQIKTSKEEEAAEDDESTTVHDEVEETEEVKESAAAAVEVKEAVEVEPVADTEEPVGLKEEVQHSTVEVEDSAELEEEDQHSTIEVKESAELLKDDLPAVEVEKEDLSAVEAEQEEEQPTIRDEEPVEIKEEAAEKVEIIEAVQIAEVVHETAEVKETFEIEEEVQSTESVKVESTVVAAETDDVKETVDDVEEIAATEQPVPEIAVAIDEAVASADSVQSTIEHDSAGDSDCSEEAATQETIEEHPKNIEDTIEAEEFLAPVSDTVVAEAEVILPEVAELEVAEPVVDTIVAEAEVVVPDVVEMAKSVAEVVAEPEVVEAEIAVPEVAELEVVEPVVDTVVVEAETAVSEVVDPDMADPVALATETVAEPEVVGAEVEMAEEKAEAVVEEEGEEIQEPEDEVVGKEDVVVLSEVEVKEVIVEKTVEVRAAEPEDAPAEVPVISEAKQELPLDHPSLAWSLVEFLRPDSLLRFLRLRPFHKTNLVVLCVALLLPLVFSRD